MLRSPPFTLEQLDGGRQHLCHRVNIRNKVSLAISNAVQVLLSSFSDEDCAHLSAKLWAAEGRIFALRTRPLLFTIPLLAVACFAQTRPRIIVSGDRCQMEPLSGYPTTSSCTKIYADSDVRVFVPDSDFTKLVVAKPYETWHSTRFNFVVLYQYLTPAIRRSVTPDGGVYFLQAHVLLDTQQRTYQTDFTTAFDQTGRQADHSSYEFHGDNQLIHLDSYDSKVETAVTASIVARLIAAQKLFLSDAANSHRAPGTTNATLSANFDPKILKRVEPGLTAEAMRNHITGSVTLDFTINTDGLAQDISVVSSPGYGLDQAAIDALKLWKFRPAYRNGSPVFIKSRVTFTFSNL